MLWEHIESGMKIINQKYFTDNYITCMIEKLYKEVIKNISTTKWYKCQNTKIQMPEHQNTNALNRYNASKFNLIV